MEELQIRLQKLIKNYNVEILFFFLEYKEGKYKGNIKLHLEIEDFYYIFLYKNKKDALKHLENSFYESLIYRKIEEIRARRNNLPALKTLL